MATYPIRQLADNGGTAQFVPVTAPEAVQFPDGSNLNTFIGSVATIESNPVAANHAVGEFLCINGQVYEVIDAITAGDSISLGENVQVTNLGSQITELNNGLMLTKILNNTAVSDTTYTLSDSIENYSELIIRVRTNSLRCTTLSIPVDDIVTDGYSSEHQYIVQTSASTANAYILYVQIAFTSSNRMQIIAHDTKGWTSALYISVYAR